MTIGEQAIEAGEEPPQVRVLMNGHKFQRIWSCHNDTTELRQRITEAGWAEGPASIRMCSFSRTTRPTARSQPKLHRLFGAHPAALREDGFFGHIE